MITINQNDIDNLPNEIKTLKYKPSYRSINQSLNQDSHMYYGQHCQLPIFFERNNDKL